MKKIRLFIPILLIGLLITGCELKPDHSIRVKNEYPETIDNLMVGTVSYGDVDSGTTTDYKPVDEGSHTLSGTTTSGLPLTGSASVTGRGSHKWTMTILSSGGLEIKED